MVTFAGGFLFWQDPGGLRSEMRDLFQVCPFGLRDRSMTSFRLGQSSLLLMERVAILLMKRVVIKNVQDAKLGSHLQSEVAF